MDKFLRLKEEREKLEQQMQNLDMLSEKIKREEGECYQNFFCEKHNKDFKLYTKFPGIEQLKSYLKYIDDKNFPLDSASTFNAQELAEMIKQFYSYQRQQEYHILTIGINEQHPCSIPNVEFCLVPHLYYLIGNDKTLAPFIEWDSQFINQETAKSIYTKIGFKNHGANLISIPLEKYYHSDFSTTIECLTDSLENVRENINYYDYLNNCYTSCVFRNYIEIFAEDLASRVFTKKQNGYKGIKDLFSFNINRNDTFIARILLSICIYKHNNGITELTSEDYHHIFKVLYGEEVDIVGEAEKDITRTLKYVPSNAEINLE